MYQDSVSAEPGSEPAEAVDASVSVAAVDAEPSTAEIADPREAGHLFRDELARAMHAAAERERARIETAADEDGLVHVDKVRSRATAEAAELKRLAEEDVTGIRGWAKTEIERIRTEADVQINDRRERLEQHLVAHASIIDGEVDRVNEAVESYRNELDVFFVRLAIERDPSEIARLADTVPEPPDLEVIRAVARAEAVERLSRLETASDTVAEVAPEGPMAVAEVEPSPEASFEAAPEVPAAGAASEGAAEASSDTESVTESEPEADLVAVPMASAESAGDAVATTAESEPELVAVMDPALADPTPGMAEPVAQAESAVSSSDSDRSDDDGPTAGAAGSGSGDAEAPMASAADMAATAGEPAGEEEASPVPEPVGAASGPAADSNAATRFIRSLTSWGSHDPGNGGHAK